MSSKLIPDETLEKIRQHFDIVDVVGQYVQLKKSGRYYFGLCPFHSEKTPSFSVSPDKQIYYCFGCGSGGDVIRFIMNIENLGYREAALYLAKDAKIDVSGIADSTMYSVEDKEREEILEVYDLTCKFYHYLLLETENGKNAFKYLSDRGFSRRYIEDFKIGYSAPSWDTLKNFLLKRGFSLELLVNAGLIIRTDDGKVYDRFRGRVIFPIFDTRDRVIALGGRVLDNSKPKYMNSPETKIFNKSKVLYNLGLAKKEIRNSRQAVLFEGYVDVISAWKAGIKNGVASLGTSLTDQQAGIIKRYTDEVIISYDSDNAGQQATLRASSVLEKQNIKVKVVVLPKGLDPDDYIVKYGSDSFKNDIINDAVSLTTFKLDYYRKDYNLNDEMEKLKFINKALEIVSDLEHAIEREYYLKVLAEEFKVSYDSLKKDLNQINFEKKDKKNSSRDKVTTKWNNIINNGNHNAKLKTLQPAYYNAEKSLIYLMMRNSTIAKKVEETVGNEFNVEDFAVLAAYLYTYYSIGYDSDVSHFLSTIEDEKYVKLATKIAMNEINEDVSEQGLNDYIMQVKNYNISFEIRKRKEEQIKADRSKDYNKSLQLGQEIIELRRRLKRGE